MNNIRSAILLLVYSVTLLTVPVSARSYDFVVPSSENTEKEAVTHSAFEHRESSSLKVTGKFTISKRPESSGIHDLDGNYNSRILVCTGFAPRKVPIYILHCSYRC